MRRSRNLYQDRFLSEGYPELAKLGVEYKKAQKRICLADEIVGSIGRLIDLSKGVRSILDVGCGPEAGNVRKLLDAGYDPVGVEPVQGSVEAARKVVGDAKRIYQGCAESLPFPDRSKRVVLLEAVLEHVDSPSMCLAEAYRVLVPDGVVYISTTNRHRLSLIGSQGEFRKRFYNWFPAILKECYVFQHLHYDPRLSNFSPRPAVHWFTFADLCKLGRNAGFARFYSKIDLAEAGSTYSKRSIWRRLLRRAIKYNTWLRAIALTQIGHIIMWKRAE